MLHNIFIIKVVWHHGETQSVAKLGIPKKSYLIKHNVISATILQYFFLFRIIQKDCRHVNYFLWADKSTSIFLFWLLNFSQQKQGPNRADRQEKKREWKKSKKDGTKNWDEWISGLDIKRTIQGEENERLRRWRVIITLWGFYWLNFNTMSVIVHAFPLLHFFHVLISF